jgi:hypothetical protein
MHVHFLNQSWLLKHLNNDFFKDNLEKYESLLTSPESIVIQSELVESLNPQSLLKPGFNIVDDINEFHMTMTHEDGHLVLEVKCQYNVCDVNVIEHPSKMEYEYIAYGVIVMRFASKQGFVALHASTIFNKQKDISFMIAAPSGTGKSTLSHRILDLGSMFSILNEDKAFIRLENELLYVYGTPFSGKTKQNLNLKTRVVGWIHLKQGDNLFIKENTSKGLSALMNNIYRPVQQNDWEMIKATMDALLEAYLGTFHARNHDDAASFIRQQLKDMI